MATNHTTNYQLNLWEPNDAFIRTEFNENFSGIDGMLGDVSRTVSQHATTLSGHTTTLAEHTATIAEHTAAITGRAQFLTGQYTGTGTTVNTINFGVPAKAVVVLRDYLVAEIVVLVRPQAQGGITTYENADYGFTASWGANSVTLNPKTPNCVYSMNSQGATYRWFVLY